MGSKIIYIAGMGRSGSTVLARLLGALPGHVNVGEGVRYLYNDPMFARRLPCGCGLDPRDCPFWGTIVPEVDPEDRAAATRLLRLRTMRWALSPRTRPSPEVRKLISGIERTYHDVLRASGGSVIVESSKHPAIAHLLARSTALELHTVHLVRDPRGIVASRSVQKDYLGTMTPSVAVTRWWALNLAAGSLRRVSDSYLRLRYESFADDPAAAVRAIVESATGQRPDLPFLEGRRAEVGPQHPLAGNPDKLADELITIRPASWSLDDRTRRFVTASTLPLLIRYGYRTERG